jgi:prolyl 4-hydroxylase
MIKIVYLVIFVLIIFRFYKEKKILFPLNPVIYKNFLNEEEISRLLESCGNYKESTLINNGKIISSYRTSKTHFIPKSNIIYNIIKKKIKDIYNIDNNIEALQLTKYQEGEFYGEHHDYFDPNNKFQKESLQKNGQRVKTIFVYIKEPIKGGETEFPLLKKKFIPKKGDALVWTNCIKKGNKYILRKESLHSGNIVKKGVKIGLNIWILD